MSVSLRLDVTFFLRSFRMCWNFLFENAEVPVVVVYACTSGTGRVDGVPGFIGNRVRCSLARDFKQLSCIVSCCWRARVAVLLLR